LHSHVGSVKALLALDGKKSIVTGAGSGIGRAIAFGLAEYGSDVALLGRTLRKLTETKKEIEQRYSAKALDVRVDVSSSTQVQDAVGRVLDVFGRVDVLVNSHGIGQWVKAEEMKEEDWDKMIDTNLKSVFLMCQAVGRDMIKRKHGKIINVASISGQIANRPQPQAHYNAAKAGVVMLTKCLAFEWAKYNINVNSISPGYTITPLVDDLLKTRPEYVDHWKGLVPLGRFADPMDMVGAAIFLASDASNYATGHDLVVDGGYTIW